MTFHLTGASFLGIVAIIAAISLPCCRGLANVVGEETILADVKNGSLVCVEFYTNWCPACREMESNMTAAFEKYNVSDARQQLLLQFLV